MIITKAFLLFFLPGVVYAEGGSYFLPGKTLNYEIDDPEGEKASYFIPGKSPDEKMEEDEKSILYFIPGSAKELDKDAQEEEGSNAYVYRPKKTDKPDLSVGNLEDLRVSQFPAGSSQNQISEFEGMDNMEKLNKLREKSKNNISFSILYDNFNYGGPPGVYDEIFGPSAINNMFFQLAYGLVFFRNHILASGGLNLGVSYKYGKGDFPDGEVSDTTIALWAVPLDISLNIQVPLGSLFRVEFSGGPSVMGMLQNRSDRDQGENGKDLYQVSPGYFLGGKFKINWGNIFKSSALALFNTTDVTNFFLNFDVRYESYNKFSDQLVKVDGTSYGIGLSFEFL